MKTVTRKSWKEFRNTGLLLIINQILHVFGWSIVENINKENGKVTDCYPARIKFRGFSGKSVSESYLKISKYMKENIDEIISEAEIIDFAENNK